MLPKSYLKLMAAHVVHKSELTRYSKVQALRFIEEASGRQLLVFMKEGQIRQVSDEENLSEIVPILIAPLVVAAAAASGAVFSRFFSQAARACSGKKGKEKTVCVKDYRIRANRARLAALKREMGKCNQTNNVKKCRNMFLKHAKKIETQIQKDKVY
ncbi:MAG: hypothetical protein ACTSX1_08690 [Candidatus Heimdallarchaeaceae archaeon]